MDVREKLFAKHTSSEYGFWEIYGEDSNADLGGHHYTPLLERIEGTYGEAVEIALSLPSFFTWGAGGYIKKVSFTKLDKNTVKRRLDLIERQKQLKEELKKVENELMDLGKK